MSAREDFIRHTMDWLNKKDRTKEEIANKMFEVATVTYDLVNQKKLNETASALADKLLSTLLKTPTV